MLKMKAKNGKVNIKDLKPYENNPRRNEEAIPFVGNSLENFDYINPIVVNKDNVILAGHTRLEALLNAGYEGEIDVRIVDYLTEEQEKAYRLADNKTGEFSAWDYSKLDDELAEMTCDMSAFGFFSNDEVEIERKDIGTNFAFSTNIIVECENENKQQELYDELTERGFRCRVE